MSITPFEPAADRVLIEVEQIAHVEINPFAFERRFKITSTVFYREQQLFKMWELGLFGIASTLPGFTFQVRSKADINSAFKETIEAGTDHVTEQGQQSRKVGTFNVYEYYVAIRSNAI